MITTLTMHAHEMSPSKESHLSRNINTAGAPLPILPRRTPSATRDYSPASAAPENILRSIIPIKVVVQQSTPPDRCGKPSTSVTNDGSDPTTSSSSDSLEQKMSVYKKRVRGVRMPAVCPPEESTPTPAVHNARTNASERCQSPLGSVDDKNDDKTPRPLSRPLIYAPGLPLRLATKGLGSRLFLESQAPLPIKSSAQDPKSISVDIPVTTRPLLRKKSGQLVKSSLKSSKSTPRGSLSVLASSGSSKSEPNTPTHIKAVHFDAKLEHVKLFLAEQKPLAVSRDASPTEDTSGTDSEFFIFGDSLGDGLSRKILAMQIPNMPPIINTDADVALENLKLSLDKTSVLGRVRVRNIAYTKWVAVRFTFDAWQTTSEVTAKYIESMDDDFDRFSFSIRLNDLLARIERKRLHLAVRYTVDGRELWDNNGGRNYLAVFMKARTISEPNSENGDDGSGGTDVADLQSKLEKVVQARECASSNFLVRPTDSVFCTSENEPGATWFASRYDFRTSMKKCRKFDDVTSPRHGSAQSCTGSSTTPIPNSIPWPDKTLVKNMGSPRDLDDNAFFSTPRVASDLKDTQLPVQSIDFVTTNHQWGYFDIKKDYLSLTTPPESPRIRSLDSTPLATSRYHSFHPVQKPWHTLPSSTTIASELEVFVDSGEGSEQSTPSFLSPSPYSSRSTTPSPTEDYTIDTLLMHNYSDEPVNPTTNYRQFLNKFCFYTGMSYVSPELLSRTQSLSDLEDFPTSTSRPHNSPSFTLKALSRSSSQDDIFAMRSGTPTPAASLLFESRPVTPVPV